ncbi:MAG TPA: pilus assembly protein N-terminal domain-containing protein [Anaeromyxobacter sp.]
MHAALIALVLAAAPAKAGAPLALAERQVVTLEFARPVVRVATTDPDLLAVQVTGAKVRVEASRAGRCTLDLTFGDGATVSYEVVVDPVRRTATAVAPLGPNELELTVGQERRFKSPGISRALYEENGVVRVAVERDTVSIVGLSLGRSSVVLVNTDGDKTTWQVVVH